MKDVFLAIALLSLFSFFSPANEERCINCSRILVLKDGTRKYHDSIVFWEKDGTQYVTAFDFSEKKGGKPTPYEYKYKSLQSIRYSDKVVDSLASCLYK